MLIAERILYKTLDGPTLTGIVQVLTLTLAGGTSTKNMKTIDKAKSLDAAGTRRPAELGKSKENINAKYYENRLVSDMPHKITLERDNKVIVTLSDGREISILVTDENGEGEHLRISGDDGLLLIPSASNQVRIKLR